MSSDLELVSFPKNEYFQFQPLTPILTGRELGIVHGAQIQVLAFSGHHLEYLKGVVSIHRSKFSSTRDSSHVHIMTAISS
jgi:hypothetical protein